MNRPILETMRRILLGLLVVAIAAFMFWDPTPDTEYDDDKTHVRYWNIAPADHAERFHVLQFNEEQDSIVVHASPIPWQEHEKKILTAILSGDPPDVINQFVPVVRWASRMALRPLDDFIEETNFDTSVFFPALWDEVTWQDRVFAIPMQTASYAFFYNKDAFREVGLDPEKPPRTWQEVIEFARKLDKYDDEGRMIRAGYLPAFSPGHTTGVLGNMTTAQLQAWELGAEYLSDDGTSVTMASEEIIRAAEWTVEYYEDYDLDKVSAFIGGLGVNEQNGFLLGKLAMIVLDMSFLDLAARHQPDLDYGVVETPSFEGYPTASSSGSFWLGIPRGAQNARAAWDFIRATVDKETQLAELAARDDDLFPANRKAAFDSTFITSEEVAVFVRQMDFAHSPTVVPLAHGVFWREFVGALERSVLKQQPTREAFEQAEAVVQDALSRSVRYDRYVRANMSFYGEEEKGE